MSQVLQLQWEWIDFAKRRVVWPDSKTGSMSKPLSAEAALLLRAAPRYAGSKFEFVRYAVPDFQAWVAERRHERTAGENARVY